MDENGNIPRQNEKLSVLRGLRLAADAAAIYNFIFIFGGSDPSTGTEFSSCEICSPLTMR